MRVGFFVRKSTRLREEARGKRSAATCEADWNHAAIGIVHVARPGDQTLPDGLVQREDRRLAALRIFGQHQLAVGGVFALELIGDATAGVGVIVGADHIAIGLPGELEHRVSRADRATVVLDGAVGKVIELIHLIARGGVARWWSAGDQGKAGKGDREQEFHSGKAWLRLCCSKTLPSANRKGCLWCKSIFFRSPLCGLRQMRLDHVEMRG